MGDVPKPKASATRSRRSGIDRRWIPSPRHTPERRSGADRRANPDRVFPELFYVNDPADGDDRS